METAQERPRCEACGQPLPTSGNEWVLAASGRVFATEIEAEAAAVRLNRRARNYEYRPATDAAGNIRLASRRTGAAA